MIDNDVYVILMSVIASMIWSFIKLLFNNVKFVLTLDHSKIFQIILKFVQYVLPIVGVLIMVFDDTLNVNLLNVTVLLVLILGPIINMILSHISTLYKLISDLSNTSRKKLKGVDETFNKVYEHIESIRNDSNQDL